VAVAQKLHSPVLLSSVRHAFVEGMHAAFLASAGIALVGAVLAMLFLPKTNVSMRPQEAATDREGYVERVR